MQVTPAAASPLQMKLQEPALRRLERATRNLPIDVARDVVSGGEMACFDDVGMRNLTVVSEISTLTVTPNPSAERLDVQVTLDLVEIRGTLYADPFFFPCFDIEEPIDPLLLDDVVVTAGIRPVAGADGTLEFVVDGEVLATVAGVSLTGPSQTVVDLLDEYDVIETMVLPQAADMAVRQMLETAAAELDARRAGAFMGVGYHVGFRQPVVEADGVAMVADVRFDLGDARAACLPEGTAKPPTSSSTVTPALPTSLAPGSGLAVAAPHALLDDALAAGWWAGALCGEIALAAPTSVGALVARVTHGEPGPFTLRYGIGAMPQMTLHGGDVELALRDATVEILGPEGRVLVAAADLTLIGSVRTEDPQRLMRATLRSARVDLHEFESVLHTSNEAIIELERFLEVDVPNDFVRSIQDLPIADAMLIDPTGRMVVDFLQTGEGVVSALSFYGSGDPEVDLLSPDTTLGSPHASGSSNVAVRIDGSDDRPTPLLYSWQVDARGWSPWSAETAVSVRLPPGEHLFEARARDSWGNVDATPAAVAFTVDDSRTLGSCACSTTGSAAPSPGAVACALIALFAITLRRPSAFRRTPARRSPPARSAIARRRAFRVAPALAGAAIVAASLPAFAQETSVLPQGRFKASASFVSWLQNPESSTTGSSVAIPTGLIQVGVDATTTEEHRVRADLAIPSLSYGATRSITAAVYVPIFLRAETDVRSFQARSLGVDVTPEAQSALRDAGFRDPDGRGDEPVSDWHGSGIGDVIVAARWRVQRTRTQAIALTGGLDLPTGRRDDPRILTDFGFGDGQLDVFADAAYERKTGPSVLGAVAGYRLRLPGENAVRPLGGPTVEFVQDPGDVIKGGVSARRAGGAIPLSASWVVEHRLRDRVPAEVSTPDRSGTVHVISANAGVSSVDAFRRRRAVYPATLSMGVSHSMSSNSRLESWQVEARVDLFL